jgi:vacuolar-type H+-ATPase subunit E/Vma4
MSDDLAPVRAALLASARAEAARIRADADAAAERTVAVAREEAAAILARARKQGAADAAALLGADRSCARRQARALVLAARREGYENLRAAARAAVLRMRYDPGYPRLRTALADAARHTLGRSARIGDTDDGGVVGQRAGRRVDLSLTGFADRAVDACAARLEDP